MHLRTIVNALAAAILIVIGLTACATDREETKESAKQSTALEAQARIAKTEAEKIALAKAPGGTVKSAELEREGGQLVWSFDIATAGTADITEVLVDAVTGHVVSVEKETPAQQAKEARAEAKKKKQGGEKQAREAKEGNEEHDEKD